MAGRIQADNSRERLCESFIDDTVTGTRTTVHCCVKEKKSWLGALESCSRSGGVLSDFKDHNEHNHLLNLATRAVAAFMAGRIQADNSHDRLCESFTDDTVTGTRTTVHCYVKEKKSWLGALESCSRSGGVLSDFKDHNEHNHLLNLATRAGHSSSSNRKEGIWLGGMDFFKNKQFEWILDNRVIPNKKVSPGQHHFGADEANNANEHCTSLEPWFPSTNRFFLNDSYCDRECYYICKYV